MGGWNVRCCLDESTWKRGGPRRRRQACVARRLATTPPPPRRQPLLSSSTSYTHAQLTHPVCAVAVYVIEYIPPSKNHAKRHGIDLAGHSCRHEMLISPFRAHPLHSARVRSTASNNECTCWRNWLEKQRRRHRFIAPSEGETANKP